VHSETSTPTVGRGTGNLQPFRSSCADVCDEPHVEWLGLQPISRHTCTHGIWNIRSHGENRIPAGTLQQSARNTTDLLGAFTPETEVQKIHSIKHNW
jgi:hypothetical protein